MNFISITDGFQSVTQDVDLDHWLFREKHGGDNGRKLRKKNFGSLPLKSMEVWFILIALVHFSVMCFLAFF